MPLANRFWNILTILLIAVIAGGGIIACSRYNSSRAHEISVTDTPAAETSPNEIYIGGAVASPGLYPFQGDDSIASLIQAAGGSLDGSSMVNLYVNNIEGDNPQKIDLNRTESWLLEALPGIGEEKAQDIISYRTEHGPFRSTDELLRVSGIGSQTLAEIKDLITVSD